MKNEVNNRKNKKILYLLLLLISFTGLLFYKYFSAGLPATGQDLSSHHKQLNTTDDLNASTAPSHLEKNKNLSDEVGKAAVPTPPIEIPETKTVPAPTNISKLEKPKRSLIKIKAVNKKDRQISSSSIGEVIYSQITKLAAPIISETVKDISIHFQKKLGQYIWLKWESSNEDSSSSPLYEVQLATSSDFSTIKKSYNTENNKVLINALFEPGSYFWRVRKLEKENKSEWSEPARFSIITK